MYTWQQDRCAIITYKMTKVVWHATQVFYGYDLTHLHIQYISLGMIIMGQINWFRAILGARPFSYKLKHMRDLLKLVCCTYYVYDMNNSGLYI